MGRISSNKIICDSQWWWFTCVRFQLGAMSLAKMRFALIASVNLSEYTELPYDGMLGLACDSMLRDGLSAPSKTLFHLLQAPLITVYLNEALVRLIFTHLSHHQYINYNELPYAASYSLLKPSFDKNDGVGQASLFGAEMPDRKINSHS